MRRGLVVAVGRGAVGGGVVAGGVVGGGAAGGGVVGRVLDGDLPGDVVVAARCV